MLVKPLKRFFGRAGLDGTWAHTERGLAAGSVQMFEVKH